MFTMGKKVCVGVGLLLIIAIAVIVWMFSTPKVTPPDASLDCLIPDEEPACYSTNPNPYRYFGKKTTYDDAVTSYTNVSELSLGNCTAKVFYLLCRHAIRNPERFETESMLKLLPTMKEKIINSARLGKSKLCEQDLAKLRRWAPTFLPGDHKKISETGHMEAEELAVRFKERFPSLLDQSYSPEKFVIEYTSQTRTRTTAEAFAKALFVRDYDRINFENKTNDDVLTFNLVCKPLQAKCPDPNYEMGEIMKSKSFVWKAMKNVLERISKKVGFPVTSEEIAVIYNACVYSHALDTDDTWCSLLSTADLKVLEFQGDIWDYYKDAYGNKINYEQACPVAKYVVDLFKSNVDADSTKTVLHFTRSSAIRKVYPVFGLFDDGVRLKADEFCTEADRAWRSSIISPFDSNIAFILFKCNEEYKVATFQNEQLVQIKGCKDTMCSYEDFYKTYNAVANRCDIKKLCCPCCKN